MMSRDDAELMRLVQRGDTPAFTALVNRHKNRLVNYLTALARDRARAEELAQDTFVRVFQHANDYREQGQFVPYLYRIATNLLRSEERKRKRRAVLLELFSRNGHGRNGSSPSPQAQLLQEELGVRVSSALAELPLRYRSPLLLREMEGWSYRDIAAALRCREGTVKSRVHRGRELLRQLLSPYWNGGRA